MEKKKCFLCGADIAGGGSFCPQCMQKIQDLNDGDAQALLEAATALRDMKKQAAQADKRERYRFMGAVAICVLFLSLAAILPALGPSLRQLYFAGLDIDLFLAIYGGGLLLLIALGILMAERWRYRVLAGCLGLAALGLYGFGLMHMPEKVGAIPISSPADFYAIERFEGGYYFLETDLTLSGDDYGGEGITIAGSFLGQGHSIACTAETGALSKGLFSLNTGSIRDLTVLESSFSGESCAALCYTNQGSIRDCSIAGSVRLEGQRAASLCFINRGEIEDCLSLAGVYASGALAGLCYENAGALKRCDFRGSLTALGEGAVDMGGFACVLKGGGSLVDCAFTGSFDAGLAQVCAGGFAVRTARGSLLGSGDIIIENSYAILSQQEGEYAEFSMYILEGSALKPTTGDAYVLSSSNWDMAVESYTRAEFTSQLSFKSFDFTSVWIMENGRPQLRGSLEKLTLLGEGGAES